MNDWGLLLFLVLCFFGGIQFLTNFIIDPIYKKKKGLNYKFNWFAVVFTIMYFIFIITISILVFTGAIRANIE